MSTVLVIVDMQHMYNAARDAELILRVEKALRRELPPCPDVAVLICNDGSGQLTVHRPSGVPVVWKNESDGGTYLYAFLLGMGVINRELRVLIGGVNMSQCVYRTATGLAARLAEEHGLTDNVTIVRDLCGDGEQYVVRFE